MTAAMTRTFVPQDFGPSDFANIQPLGSELIERPIGSPSELEAWLLDASELTAVIREHASRLNIDYSCHTDDAEKEAAFMQFIEQVRPKLAPMHHKLQRKYVECEWRVNLETTPRLRQLGKEWQASVELYRDENVPLFTQITRKVTEYDKRCAQMTVEFDGKTRTLQQMGRYLDEPDRDVRQQAWTLTAQRRLEDRESIDELFDQTLELRAQVARNADCENFRDYQWQAMQRFDYTPADCMTFAQAIEAECMPLVEKLTEERRTALGFESLRPWDTAVDPRGRSPLRPFDPDDVADFVARTRRVFDRIDPKLGEQFGALKLRRNLDLESRRGKRPGGYQASLEESREPFIFMNAAGVQRDVQTMLHEGGHAFHYQAASNEPLVFLRHGPIEFCEVASMSMELLGGPHLDAFYSEQDHARAQRVHLEGIIKFFPWMATIDQFQHWLYAESPDGIAGRTEHWLRICERFSAGIDWSGHEDARRWLWQRQLHLFHHPFYYVEYGIAQLGALQVWQNYRADPKRALARLLEAFALGGTRPLPELFEVAGIRFDFSRETIGPLMKMVSDELDGLPV